MLQKLITADVGQRLGSIVIELIAFGSALPTRDKASSAASLRIVRSAKNDGFFLSEPSTNFCNAATIEFSTSPGNSSPASLLTDKTYDVRVSLPSSIVGKYFSRPSES